MLRKNNTGKIQEFVRAKGFPLRVLAGDTFEDSECEGMVFDDINYPPISMEFTLTDTTNKEVTQSNQKLHVVVQTYGTSFYYLSNVLSAVEPFADSLTLYIKPFKGVKERAGKVQKIIPDDIKDSIHIVDFTTDIYASLSEKEQYAHLCRQGSFSSNDIVFHISDSDLFYDFNSVVEQLNKEFIAPGVYSYDLMNMWKSLDILGWTEKAFFCVVENSTALVNYFVKKDVAILDHYDFAAYRFAFVNSFAYIKQYLKHQSKRLTLSFPKVDDYIDSMNDTFSEDRDVCPYRDTAFITDRKSKRIGTEQLTSNKISFPFLSSINKLCVVLPLLEDTIEEDALFSYIKSFVLNTPAIAFEFLLLVNKNIRSTQLKLVEDMLKGYGYPVTTYTFDLGVSFASITTKVMLTTNAKYFSIISDFFIYKNYDWFKEAYELLKQDMVLGWTIEGVALNNIRQLIFSRDYYIHLGSTDGQTPQETIKYLYKNAPLYGRENQIIKNNIMVT